MRGENKRDRVRLQGGETVPRRLEHKGETTLRPPDVPPVDIDGWEVLDDQGGVVEFSITLRTGPGEPGLTLKELGEVNPAAIHHNRVLFEVWKHRAAIRAEDFEMLVSTGRSFDDLARERRRDASDAIRVTDKRMHSASVGSPEKLAEVLEAFETGGINAVMKLGFSRSHGYKLVARARDEVKR